MDYAILRYEKRKLAGAEAMARHQLRDGASPANADPSAQADNAVLVGPATTAEAMARLRERMPPRRRRDAVCALDVYVSASPEAMHAMPRAQQDAYFRRAIEWVGQRFGGRANVISATVHRDESTPHMHMLVVPLLDGVLNAKALVGNRARMQAAQDLFAEQVGKHFGLRRGERSSAAHHTTIRQFYGAIEAAGRADALPPRVPMPALPPKPQPPGLLAGRQQREQYQAKQQAYEAAQAAREHAQQANATRQAEIERLARAGLATHARSRRSLPRRLREAEQTIQTAQVAQAVIDRAAELLGRLTPQQQAQVLDQARQAVQKPAQAPREPPPVRQPQRGPRGPS